jgi:hypothetical protein
MQHNLTARCIAALGVNILLETNVDLVQLDKPYDFQSLFDIGCTVVDNMYYDFADVDMALQKSDLGFFVRYRDYGLFSQDLLTKWKRHLDDHATRFSIFEHQGQLLSYFLINHKRGFDFDGLHASFPGLNKFLNLIGINHVFHYVGPTTLNISIQEVMSLVTEEHKDTGLEDIIFELCEEQTMIGKLVESTKSSTDVWTHCSKIAQYLLSNLKSHNSIPELVQKAFRTNSVFLVDAMCKDINTRNYLLGGLSEFIEQQEHINPEFDAIILTVLTERHETLQHFEFGEKFPFFCMGIKGEKSTLPTLEFALPSINNSEWTRQAMYAHYGRIQYNIGQKYAMGCPSFTAHAMCRNHKTKVISINRRVLTTNNNNQVVVFEYRPKHKKLNIMLDFNMFGSFNPDGFSQKTLIYEQGAPPRPFRDFSVWFGNDDLAYIQAYWIICHWFVANIQEDEEDEEEEDEEDE